MLAVRFGSAEQILENAINIDVGEFGICEVVVEVIDDEGLELSVEHPACSVDVFVASRSIATVLGQLTWGAPNLP